MASHDLQEPLRKILIFSQLLKAQHSQEFLADRGRYLDKIIDSSTRMKTIITDVLNYSRLSSQDTNTEVTDLRGIVNEVLTDFELLIAEKKATVAVGELPKLEVNPGQIRQVFHNLISNALKFSKPTEPPVIEIKSLEGSRVDGLTSEPFYLMTITDNGIGFDEKYVDKVFSLFHRLNTKDAYEGSGIGLAIAKRIIDRHGGTISVLSQEDVGSQFTIGLPLRQNKPTPLT